jgi:type IV pilus assembly protein PilM
MRVSRKTDQVVGVDIETGSAAATQLEVNGATRVVGTAIAPLGPGVMRDGEVVEPESLGAALKDMFAEHKLPRNVRVGIASQRVVVRTIRLPLIEKHSELETAIRFQAAEQIPMPLDQAVLDWRVLESDLALREARQMDVVVVAARRDTVAGFTNALRTAGLRPVGVDVSAFAMIRALADAGLEDPPAPVDGEAGEVEPRPAPARLLCNLGDVTNLAVSRGGACLFTRVSSFGIEGIAQRLAERRELTLEHARQWLIHVGLDQPAETVEGDPEIVEAARAALLEGVAKLAGEMRLSLDYYGSQEGALAIEEIVICGAGTSIPGLAANLERELGFGIRVARPAALAALGDPTAARLTLSYGLALEE